MIVPLPVTPPTSPFRCRVTANFPPGRIIERAEGRRFAVLFEKSSFGGTDELCKDRVINEAGGSAVQFLDPIGLDLNRELLTDSD